MRILNKIVDYLPEEFNGDNPIGMDKKSEIEYHKGVLKKILNKKSSTDPSKPLLENNELVYIQKLQVKLDEMEKNLNKQSKNINKPLLENRNEENINKLNETK